jgi:hypothetical protein
VVQQAFDWPEFDWSSLQEASVVEAAEERRRRRNEESRERASHHRERWTGVDTQELIDDVTLWKRDHPRGSLDEALDAAAPAVGRTVEACRTQFYKWWRGKAHPAETVHPAETPPSGYRGWMEGMGDGD